MNLVTFISYTFLFVTEVNEICILIYRKINWEILKFFKISWDTSRTKVEPESRECASKPTKTKTKCASKPKVVHWRIESKLCMKNSS